MRKRRICTALLASALVVSMVLAGCSAGGTATATQAPPAQGQTNTTQPPGEEAVHVSWAFWDMATIDYGYAQNAYCREKMGIQIEPIALEWGTWSEQVKLMAATDSMPDVVSTYTVADMNRLSAWINQGIIRDIPKDMVAKYKNVQKNFDENIPMQGFTKVWNDTYYFMPRTDYLPETHTSTHMALYYRKDWAEKLGHTGYEASEGNVVTKDMIQQMFIDFAQKDPDENGANDTYGFTLAGSVPTILMGPWGVDPAGWFEDADGVYKPGYVNPGVVAALQWYQDLYKAGALDPEFAQNDWKAQLLKASVQTVGGFLRQVDTYPGNVIQSIWESDNQLWDDPLAKWAILSDPWVDENTPPRLTNIDDMCGSEIAAHVSDEKLEAILKAQDWMLSEEGSTIKLFGMEGVDYTVVDGKKVLIEDKPAPEGFVLPGSLGWWDGTGRIFNPEKVRIDAERYEKDKGLPAEYWIKVTNYMEKVNDVRNRYYDPTLKNIEYTFILTPALEGWAPGFGEKYTQWVITDVDIQKEFDAYVQDLYNKGLQQVIDEVNAQMKK